MYKLFIILFLFVFYQGFSQAEIVKKIEISGNQRVSNETIKAYGGINVNKDYSEQDLNKILTNLFSTNFFEDVKVKLSNGVLIVQVEEYPVINALIILGENSKKYKDKILELISLKQKDSFIENRLAKDIEIIKKLYASAGFNFVKVDTKIRKIDQNNLDLIFEIDRGEETKI